MIRNAYILPFAMSQESIRFSTSEGVYRLCDKAPDKDAKCEILLARTGQRYIGNYCPKQDRTEDFLGMNIACIGAGFSVDDGYVIPNPDETFWRAMQ